MTMRQFWIEGQIVFEVHFMNNYLFHPYLTLAQIHLHHLSSHLVPIPILAVQSQYQPCIVFSYLVK